MPTPWSTFIWSQFGAAIDMLEKAITACPAPLWDDRAQHQLFWYNAYHTLFWLDLYLSGAWEDFAAPTPFGLEELDPAGVLPPRVYTPAELLDYLAYCRRKCRAVLAGLTDEQANHPCTFPWGTLPFGELLLDNMRHVHGHAAELSLMLGQQTGAGPGYVTRTRVS